MYTFSGVCCSQTMKGSRSQTRLLGREHFQNIMWCLVRACSRRGMPITLPWKSLRSFTAIYTPTRSRRHFEHVSPRCWQEEFRKMRHLRIFARPYVYSPFGEVQEWLQGRDLTCSALVTPHTNYGLSLIIKLKLSFSFSLGQHAARCRRLLA